MNKLQFIILLAGLFQLFSQVSDQYVIQNEQVIRNIENEITQKRDLMEENVNSNISYGAVYTLIVKDTFIKLELINKRSDISLLIEHLKRNKDIMYDNLNILMSNSYLKFDDPKKFFEPFIRIDNLLNSKKNIMSIKEELITNFTPGTGLILNHFYSQNKKLEISVSELDNKLKDINKFKYFILIIGMICNIISVSFILLFFLNVFKKNDYK